MALQSPVQNSLPNQSADGTVTISRGKSLLRDFMASVVVFLVALPFCMGIALASNVPISAGLISAIVGGLVVGVLAGSPMQISGPAAGLTVLVYQLVSDFGIEALGFVVIVAGVVQLIAAMLRVGQWFRAISPAVVQGMLAGIGVLILASQFHVMVDDAPRPAGLQNIMSIPQSLWLGLMPHDSTTHHHAARIGVMTIVILACWKLVTPKKLHVIPAALAAVVIATLTADFQSLDIKFIEVPDHVISSIQLPNSDTWHLLHSRGMTVKDVLLTGLAFGLVASAETLLSVVATDRLHQGPRAKYDRELMAQGVGNILCGIASGLPMAGGVTRSAASIQAGARSRLSAILHGGWILLFCSVLPHALELIPKSCLGAILVYAGYRMINPRAAYNLLAYGKSEFFIYLATVVSIVTIDLLTGVLIGIGLSAAKLLYTFSNMKIDLRHDSASNECRLRLSGAVTFLRLPKLAQTLEALPPDCELYVDVSRVSYIDHACLDLLSNWRNQHEDSGGKLIVDWGRLHSKFFEGPSRSLTQSAMLSREDVEKVKALSR